MYIYIKDLKLIILGLGCSSVVECLPGVYKVLGLIPQCCKNKLNNNKIQLLFKLISLLFVCCQDRVSLCSLGYPGTISVDQAGPKLTKLACLCLASAGIKGVHHDCLAL